MNATGAKVETKVTAASGSAFVAGLVIWVLGKYVFKGEVSDVLQSWVYAVVPGLMAFAAGWLAKHTPRAVDLAVAEVVKAAEASIVLPTAPVVAPDPGNSSAQVVSPK